MTAEVRYFSRGGNTRRMALRVAELLEIKAHDVTEPVTARADVVLMFAAVYAGSPDPAVVTYIRQNARDIGKLVVFSSSASGKSTFHKLKAVGEDMGIAVSEAFYHCPGAFWIFHKGRPNEADCQAAAAFAKAQITE